MNLFEVSIAFSPLPYAFCAGLVTVLVVVVSSIYQKFVQNKFKIKIGNWRNTKGGVPKKRSRTDHKRSEETHRTGKIELFYS